MSSPFSPGSLHSRAITLITHNNAFNPPGHRELQHKISVSMANLHQRCYNLQSFPIAVTCHKFLRVYPLKNLTLHSHRAEVQCGWIGSSFCVSQGPKPVTVNLQANRESIRESDSFKLFSEFSSIFFHRSLCGWVYLELPKPGFFSVLMVSQSLSSYPNHLLLQIWCFLARRLSSCLSCSYFGGQVG